jgi:hypothetical protein
MAVSFIPQFSVEDCLLAFLDFYIRPGNDFVGILNKCFINAVMEIAPLVSLLTTSTGAFKGSGRG